MLFGISGNLGSGKTLFLTKFLIDEYKAGNKVYANFDLFKIPYERVESPNDIFTMQEGIFGADELWLWADSRLSMTKRNKFLSFVLARSRHAKIDIIYTTQSFMQIDVRIRRLTDIMFFPSYDKRTGICRVESINRNTSQSKTERFMAKPIFQYYDTHEKINIPDYYEE